MCARVHPVEKKKSVCEREKDVPDYTHVWPAETFRQTVSAFIILASLNISVAPSMIWMGHREDIPW